MEIKYLLDEHIPTAYRTQLIRLDPELVVKVIGDPNSPSKSTPDPDILIWCEVNNFILVTNNRKSMPGHLVDHLAQNRHVPGILVVDFERGIGPMLELLAVVARASFPGEYRDRIQYL